MAIKISGTTVIDDTRNLTSINTTATGNVTVTGFANVSTTLAAGNTTITGFANVSSNINAASFNVGATQFANTTGVYATFMNSKTEGNLNVNNATTAYSKTEGNLNVNSALYANASITNTFTVGTGTYFVSNGNVGVGNTTPGHKLAVQRASGLSTPGEAYFTDGTYWTMLNTRQNPGTFNPLVQSGDHTLIYSDGTSGTGAFVLGQWSTNPNGIRITTAGDVGIGIASPYAKLNIFKNATYNSEVDAGLAITSSASSNTASMLLGSDNTNNISYIQGVLRGVSWSHNISLQPMGGNVGIGNTTPAHKLRVTGTTSLAGAVTDITTLAAGNTTITGFINSTSTVTAVDFNSTSDVRYKNNIVVIENALDKVNQLSGYTFTMNETGEKSTGLIAQEVEKVLPEAVRGEDKKTLSYGNMIGLLVEAIKEQGKKIEVLESELNRLREQ